jgi:hypothetical protein
MTTFSMKGGRRALLALAAALLLTQGCLFSDDEAAQGGVVRSEQADVYSSTALVALKVATVKKGDRVEILRRESVTGPTYTEDWLMIQLNDKEETSGWIEARHVVSEAVVKQSAEVAKSPQELPSIAEGRLKVNQRLRLAPGRDAEVAAVLKRGTEFAIVGKRQTTYKPDAKPKPGTNSSEEQADEPEAAAEDEPETKTDTWYQVRLGADSIVKGGWLLAPTVSLEVPDEILHLEGDGRRFVAWQVVGTVQDERQGEKKNYVTFMRRGGAPDEVDFERVYFLFWNVNAHNYVSPWVEDVRGVFPITQREEGNRRFVTIHVLDERNEPTPVDYEVIATADRRWQVRRITGPIRGERPGRR